MGIRNDPGIPAARPGTGGNMAPPPGMTHDTFTDCLGEMINRTPVSRARMEMHDAIRGFVHKNLEKKEENYIGDNVFRTGFAGITCVTSPNYVLPPGERLLSKDEMTESILSAAYYHALLPHVPKLRGAFTLQDLIEGRPPAAGMPPIPPREFANGQDAYGNPVATLQSTNEGTALFTAMRMPQIKQSAACGSDQHAAMRAAWLCILQQQDPRQLRDTIKARLPDDRSGIAERVAEMADVFQLAGLDAISNQPEVRKAAMEGGREVQSRLQYPASPAAPGQVQQPYDCEEELMKLTQAMLSPVKDCRGRPLSASGTDEQPYHSGHIFSLMKMFGVAGIFMREDPLARDPHVVETVGKDGAALTHMFQPTSVSVMHNYNAEVVNKVSDPALSCREQGKALHEVTRGMPAVVRMANGEYRAIPGVQTRGEGVSRRFEELVDEMFRNQGNPTAHAAAGSATSGHSSSADADAEDCPTPNNRESRSARGMSDDDSDTTSESSEASSR